MKEISQRSSETLSSVLSANIYFAVVLLCLFLPISFHTKASSVSKIGQILNKAESIDCVPVTEMKGEIQTPTEKFLRMSQFTGHRSKNI